MKRKLAPTISEPVKAIRAKLEAGQRVTNKEKQLEVTRDEAAYLLTTLAGRVIEPNYLKQLTRGEKPRLMPARLVGNTYMYTVEALLGVHFTKAHTKEPKKEGIA